MHPLDIHRTVRRLAAALAAVALLVAASPARAQAPDFDAVAWLPLGCDAGDGAGDESPADVDLVGDATDLAAYYAHDASYLYLRYRVDGNPAGAAGFSQYSWNALMQVPSGNPFQYQFELALNGKTETVEIWANTSAKDISFSPMFNDSAETQLFSAPAGTLARHVPAGSSFDGSPDYFVDVAFPVSALVDVGAIATAADLDASFYFPATATNPNNYNKGYLDCPFQPGTVLAIDKTVSPTTVNANQVAPIVYTIAVHNDGAALARGVVIEDPTLPAYLSAPLVTVTSADGSVVWTVVSANPLEVRVPNLPAGSTVTVQLAADAAPDCYDNAFTNVATAFATNAPMVSDQATLTLNLAAGGCAGCASDADCDDANACTTDACVAGACTSTAQPGCSACGTAADCEDDGDACTVATCNAGVCETTTTPGCTACAVDAECDDGDACTIDACVAETCTHATDAICSRGGPVETCDNGVDDDGDAAIDCADTDCTGSPACESPQEVCGDCIDNDGDGLVDYEDPDCCATTMALDVQRLVLKVTPKKRNGQRLKLRAGYAGYTPAAFDPMGRDTTIQLSDPDGTIFCQHMPANAWRHPRTRVFQFRDKTGTMAGGLKRGRFKTMKKSGAIRFRAVGRRVELRPTDGHDVRVTVGVGEVCSQAMTQLRSKRRRMIFP